MSSVVNYPINEIKADIRNSDKVFYYKIPNKGAPVLVSYGPGKSIAKLILYEKIELKPEKYVGARIWRVSLKLHDESAKGVQIFGDVLAMLENFIVKPNLRLKRNIIEGMTGPIWFTKKWLEYHGWSNKYIRNIVEKVSNGEVTLRGVGPNMYNIKFK